MTAAASRGNPEATYASKTGSDMLTAQKVNFVLQWFQILIAYIIFGCILKILISAKMAHWVPALAMMFVLSVLMNMLSGANLLKSIVVSLLFFTASGLFLFGLQTDIYRAGAVVMGSALLCIGTIISIEHYTTLTPKDGYARNVQNDVFQLTK